MRFLAGVRWRWVTVVGLSWLALAVVIGVLLFLTGERTVAVASHEATVSPDLSGHVVVRTGALLPDARADSGSPVGLEIVLGKTDAATVEELTQRYAAIGSNPQPQVANVQRAVGDLAVDSALRGLALAALPLLVAALLGQRRRRELLRRAWSREGVFAFAVLLLVTGVLVTPWRWGDRPETEEEWIPLASFLGPSVTLPDEAQRVEILSGGVTTQTRRLVESAVSTYNKGVAFYDDAAEAAATLDLREPEEGETVVLLVSDRHDNIGMDPVARAIADAGGATAVFDAGDDTSTGESWEAFSLDSLNEAFDDLDRWAVAGNHDHGDFVRSRLEDLGWTYFDGEVIDGPADSRLLGIDDPRSSGFGDWRDETGISFTDVAELLADAACAADEDGERVGTLLVHDANLGDPALERGCVDLVVGGHTHVQDGPTLVEGDNRERGYTFTVGTAGGAAYAVAVGGKLRRPAGLALITYADGRPVGIQGVTLQTTGRWDVGRWVPLTY